MDEIQKGINFSLSYDVTGICTPGDTRVLPLVLDACKNFTQLSPGKMEEMIESGKQYEPLFA